MKVDEWVIREVINTLHQANITLLRITGLDSPQEVAKKRVENETAINRRIKSAIDLLESSVKEVERFDPKTFQPFDKILTRDCPNDTWTIEFFSCMKDESSLIKGFISYWDYVIPYNEETKHLLGTKEDCPEYYKWWEK